MTFMRNKSSLGNAFGLSLTMAVCLLLIMQSGIAGAGFMDKVKKKVGTDTSDLDQEADGVSGEEQPAAAGTYEGPKKIIAATKFKSTSGINWDNGEAMGAMLSEALMATGRFIVVERAELGDLITEQDLGAEGRTTPQTAAKIGQMLGASILVMGTVTQFEEQAAGKSGGVGVPVPGLGSVILGGGLTTAYVKVNLRLVDTATGKILSTHNADGTASGKSKSGGAYIKGFNLQGATERKTPLGQAAQDAIDQAVEHITRVMAKVPFYARVAAIEGGDIYINAGTNRGMKEGMELNGYKVVKEIKDPDTGMVISMVEEKTGTVRIKSVQEKVSIAEKIDGTVEMGQKLRLD